MLEMATSPEKTRGQWRLFGNEPAVAGFAMLVALLITGSIVLLQRNLRAGQYDPEGVTIFYRLFIFEDYPASFLFIATLLIAAVPQAQRTAVALSRSIGEHPLLVSVVTCVVLAAGAVWVYHAHPLSMDESAPYMQSKVFAAGKLLGQYPPDLLDWLIYPPFQNYFIQVSHQTGEIASSYWPGFALLLTPFMAAGVPWLCNPVLGALSVWVIHRLTLRLTRSVEAAGASALFTLASAAFVMNAISFYSMAAHLLCNAVFALLLLRPTPGRCVAAGFIGGLALTLHNPIPHMLFAAVWLLWLATQKNRWILLGSIAAGYLPWIIVVGLGWSHLLHSLMEGSTATAQSVAGGRSQIAEALKTLGNVFKLPGPTQLEDRLIAVSKIWLWAAPLSVLLAALGFWRHRGDTHFRLLVASAAVTFVGYLFVPLNQGHGWGFRYFHSVWFVLPIFAAAALAPARKEPATDAGSEANSLGRWTLAGALGGLLIMTPYFAWQVHTFIGSDLAQIPATDHGQPRVIFINSSIGYYRQDLVQNDPFLRESPIRMVTHGRSEDARMMAQQFPDFVLLTQSPRGSVCGYRGNVEPPRLKGR